MDTLQAIILAIIGGGAFGFLQFLVTRNDNKLEDRVDKRFDRLDKKMEEIEKAFNVRIDNLTRKIDDVEANNARIRILRFSEEIQRGEKHSKESFDQVHQDIDDYNKHCKKYEDYENSRAVDAIKNIEDVYSNALKLQAEGKQGFLT